DARGRAEVLGACAACLTVIIQSHTTQCLLLIGFNRFRQAQPWTFSPERRNGRILIATTRATDHGPLAVPIANPGTFIGHNHIGWWRRGSARLKPGADWRNL